MIRGGVDCTLYKSLFHDGDGPPVVPTKRRLIELYESKLDSVDTEYAYELKNKRHVICYGCARNVYSTRHTCRVYDLYGVNDWLSCKASSVRYQEIRKRNFANILDDMIDSGRIVTCERFKRVFLENALKQCHPDNSITVHGGIFDFRRGEIRFATSFTR